MQQSQIDDGVPRCTTVPKAGKALGLGRNAAYAAAARGEIPTIRIGRRLLVPIDELRDRLRNLVR